MHSGRELIEGGMTMLDSLAIMITELKHKVDGEAYIEVEDTLKVINGNLYIGAQDLLEIVADLVERLESNIDDIRKG